jgi:hypothetical protein
MAAVRKFSFTFGLIAIINGTKQAQFCTFADYKYNYAECMKCVCNSTIANLRTVRIFEGRTDRLNVERICRP